MRSFLVRLFLENAALKAVSLILALTLFILVHGERDAVVAAKIKVVYTMPEDRVLMTDPVDQVRVRIRGSWTRVKRFDEADVDPIYVDLNDARDGELAFHEDMIRLPPGLKVVSVNPATFRLQFEPRASKTVPVTAAFDGDPAPGYRVVSTVIAPPTIDVRGAKSLVDAVRSVETRKVSVKGRKESFSERVGLAPVERHLSVAGPAVVRVDVRIAEEQGELVLPQVPVGVTVPPGSPPGRRQVHPETVAVVLRGDRRAIDAVDRRAVSARVELHAPDLAAGGGRRVPVVVDGAPAGVAIEVTPPEVTLVRGSSK